MHLSERFKTTRAYTESICASLKTEDYVVQPVVDVSPPKWHLGHTTWFFETFILKPYAAGYREFDPDYNFVFNSYYESVGARVIRTDRGNLSRPTVEEVYRYRAYVDQAMNTVLAEAPAKEVQELVILGINHEQQHQELLATDIKYILGHNPLFPAYGKLNNHNPRTATSNAFRKIPSGIYDIGYEGDQFCFDNELGRHKVYLQEFEIAEALVTNGEYLAFMADGGYRKHAYWHAEGLDWVRQHNIKAPLYWHEIDGRWHHYTPEGLMPVEADEALCHISFFEASAFASWKGMRLPTEFEWEIAAPVLNWGARWEWTNSAYLPYPGFRRSEGAIGEYNGKFMVNQMVLRGASEVTPEDFSRVTYRNFFHAHLRWQYTGIRLVKDEEE